jgi:murein DD-endopeptidase MepM/ murein hydrolase activator NlpD
LKKIKLKKNGTQIAGRLAIHTILPMRVIKILFLLIFFLTGTACSFVGGYGARQASPKKPFYHVISKGENLLAISTRYGTTPEQILLLNGLKNARVLKVGYRLHVGYGSSSSSTIASAIPVSIRQGGRPQSILGQTFVEYQGGRLLWPLAQPARLVSKFGPRGGSFHDGIDIAAPTGTTILASNSGIVAYSGSELGGYGNLILIKGEDNLITVYAHNKRNLVKKGDTVSRGQKIAEVGATGRTQGPHLHFEVRSQDSKGRAVAVDPLPLLKPDKGEKPGFRVNESLKPLLAWLDR